MARQDGNDAPRRIGRYLLTETVGEGGMGVVHRAEAVAAAGVVKELCIKRIRRERLARPGAVQRFVDEARLSVRLAHANIVTVFDFGRAGDEYYLAMERVDGVDLRTLLRDSRDREDPIAPEVAAHVAAELARALAYAHELEAGDGRSIVHCDVKPSNVLVSTAGDVKLSDFGVATFAGRGGGGAPGGTPRYMAPELEDDAAPSPQSDLYSLGVLLGDMLEGRRVEPEGPEYVGSALERLSSILKELLAVSPAERPASAREVANALEEVVGRARADGSGAPRDDLARRARRAASAARDAAAGGSPRELGPDASFLRDGEGAGFDRLMTETTHGSSAELEPDGPRPEQGEADGAHRAPRRRRPWTAVVVSAAAALALVGGWAGTRGLGADGPTPRGEGAAAPGHDEVIATLSTKQDPLPRAPSDEVEPRPDGVSGEDGLPAEEASQSSADQEPTAREPTGGAQPTARPRDHGSSSSEGSPRRTDARTRRDSAEPAPAAAAAEPARLSVNAVPWAEVRVDGRRVGVTPLLGLSLPPGRHVVQLSNEPLGIERQTPVVLAPGESRDLIVDLQPPE